MGQGQGHGPGDEGWTVRGQDEEKAQLLPVGDAGTDRLAGRGRGRGQVLLKAL